MLVAYFEVAMGPEDNKPIRVTPILGPKNLSPYYIGPPQGFPPVGWVVFRWRGGSLKSA